MIARIIFSIVFIIIFAFILYWSMDKYEESIGMKKKKPQNRPFSEKKAKTKRFKKFKVVAFVFLGFFVAGLLSVMGLFAYYAKDLPHPDRVNKRVVAESTKIFDRTGQVLLYEIHGEEKRTIIPANEIPDSVKYATIVLEDQKFFNHHGIDFQGVLRAVIRNVLKRDMAEGGSTITQQFIKNSLLTSEKKLSRKIKELILAIEIEQKYSKDDILRMYLNEIPYGSNAYGIEAAAQTFFGVHAKELTLAQSALLASLPKAPTYYSPFGSHTEQLLNRWRYAIDQMAELGYITREQAEAAKSEDILSQLNTARTDIKAPHFVLYIKEKLVEEFGEEEIQKGGFKVITTLDWNLQELAEKVVREGVEENGEKYGFSNAALVSTNPKTGEVLAMVGSKDYFDKSIDGNVNVAIRPRQPGSSFKPYVYANAFTKGYTPETVIFDVETEFSLEDGKSYTPQNYDGKVRGPVKMKEALAMSLNIPAVKTLYLAGVKDTIKFAKSLGITTLNDPDRYGLSLVLGGGEVKLLDHVGAFGVFGNEGKKVPQKLILKIEDHNGNIIKDFSEVEEEQVLDREVALEMCQIMSDNDLRAPVFGTNNNLFIPGYQIAAKTGTTNEWRDGWLVGTTPSLAVGVWTGNNDNTPMKKGADGSYTAGPIWNKFMREALKNHVPEEFPKPEEREKTGKPILDGEFEFEEKIEVCKYDDGKYCLANSKCPDSKREKKRFFNAHTILFYIDREDPLGDPPQDPSADPQFKNWEKAVKKWAEDEAGDKKFRVAPTEECKKSMFSFQAPSIKITRPQNGEVVASSELEIETEVSSELQISQVDFFLDGENIGSQKNSPFKIKLNLPESKNGQEGLIVARVFDEKGEKGEDEVRVVFQF